METRGLQGWAADPFRLHAERYFSAGHPTKLVRDGNVEAFDDPPSDRFFPVPPAEPDRRSYTQPTPASPANGRSYAPMAAASSRSSAASAQAQAQPRTYRPAVSLPAPYGPGLSSDPAPVNSSYGLPAPYGPGPDAEPERSRRPRRAWLFAGAGGVVAVTVIASVILLHESGPATGSPQTVTAAAASVVESARQTLTERTATITLTGTMSAGGKSTAVYATGTTNFAAHATTIDLHIGSAAGTQEEKSILVKGSSYFARSLNGKNVPVAAGKTWVQRPAQESAAADIAGSDPVASLSVLDKHGSLVQILGTKMIGGVSCTGYSVQPSKGNMIATARAEQVSLGVPAATVSQEVQQIEALKSPRITVWIDAQNLVREMSMNLVTNVAGPAGTASMAVNFSNFGAPVSISPPAPSGTTSYTSFLTSLGRSPSS